MRGGEQGQSGALGAGRAVAVLGGEAVHGLALPLGEDVVEPVGDADAGVVVADLGLVVPEHGQPAAQHYLTGDTSLEAAEAWQQHGLPLYGNTAATADLAHRRARARMNDDVLTHSDVATAGPRTRPST